MTIILRLLENRVEVLMFHQNRWARAFVGVLGENAEAAFLCLKAMAPPVKSLCDQTVFGRASARRLEAMLRESCAAAGLSGDARDSSVCEYAIRFLCLLAEKNCVRHIDSALVSIEKQIDEQKGILEVIAESAGQTESGFEEDLRRRIAEKLVGFKEIKLKTLVAPELLGGYRLRIGCSLIDASLKGQLEALAADITGE